MVEQSILQNEVISPRTESILQNEVISPGTDRTALSPSVVELDVPELVRDLIAGLEPELRSRPEIVGDIIRVIKAVDPDSVNEAVLNLHTSTYYTRGSLAKDAAVGEDGAIKFVAFQKLDTVAKGDILKNFGLKSDFQTLRDIAFCPGNPQETALDILIIGEKSGYFNRAEVVGVLNVFASGDGYSSVERKAIDALKALQG